MLACDGLLNGGAGSPPDPVEDDSGVGIIVPPASDGGTSTPAKDVSQPPPRCGHGACDSGETTASCPVDCPQPPAAIWKPSPGATLHLQFTGELDMNVNVTAYDVDVFDRSASTISTLRAKGRKVICYFSAGSVETWRPDFNFSR